MTTHEVADLADPGELADELAAAVLDVEGVVRLHTGVLDEIGTYLPGRRVGGVRVRGDVLQGQGSVEVHVVVAPDVPVRGTARDVHAAVARRLSRHDLSVPVLVHVDDVADAAHAADAAD